MTSHSVTILRNHPTQSASSINGWNSALVGMPFIAVGVWVGLCVFGFVAEEVYAPKWIIGAVGSTLCSIGLFLFINGMRGEVAKARYHYNAAKYPGQPWFYDFRWHREGIAFFAFNSMAGRLLAALIWSVFLIPFLWIAFADATANWVFVAIPLLLAICGLSFWLGWVQNMAELLVYGNSFLRYKSFPYILGGKLRVHLRVHRNLSKMDALSLTLRCVEERYLTSGDSTHIVCYELYQDVASVTPDRLAALSGREIDVEFSLPADRPPTSLSSTPPVYWEIEARGQAEKISYLAFFLVPIYKAL